MEKKGQVAVFIVFGFIFLLAVILLSYYVQQTAPSLDEQALENAELQQDLAVPTIFYIETCLKNVAQESIVRLGDKSWDGNALTTLEDGRQIQTKKRIDELVNAPARDELQQSLKIEIIANIPECLNQQQNTAAQMKITTESIDVMVQDNGIQIILRAPTRISMEDTTVMIKEYYSQVVFPVADVSAVLNSIFSALEDDYPRMPAGKLAILSLEHNFTYNLISLDSNHVLFTILYDDILIDDEPYTFSFIAKYPWEQMLIAEREGAEHE